MTGDIVAAPIASALAEVRRKAAEQQRLAADPEGSAWVSANAGTGKTHVLVQRVLRLLMSGAGADSILCLTFTKAAAAEMSNRLMRELSRWPAMPDAALRPALASVLHRAPGDEELTFARCLFAKVLDAPGGLKIITIHAFCDRVLRRFPLEAGVPPSFAILTDEERAAALREASDIVLRQAAEDEGGPLGKALLTAISYAGETQFDELLQGMLSRRDEVAALIRALDEEGAEVFAAIERSLRHSLGVLDDATPDEVLAEQGALVDDALIARAVAVLGTGSTSEVSLAEKLGAARGRSGEARVKALAKALLTADGTARADRGFITKALRQAHPSIAADICAARDAFADLEIKRRAVEVASASAALMQIADAVLQHYEDAKAQRSALDFDGLIARTAALFQRSDAAAWVLFRLDADLNHILVDEAQDTSPSQWALIRALTGEFFSGEGVEERKRTLFAVGDEKQSIYGFQGAVPRQFAEAGRDYASRARATGEIWRETPMALSFRSTGAVLDAVDLVFADRERTPGLSAEGRAVRHFAYRDGQAGLVEIWPLVSAEAADGAPAWEPFSESAAAPPPAMVLANRIARQIRHWLDSGERLVSANRPIRAGDILILVRKRAPFAAPMVKALKAHGIPVAGADRMKLTEQLAVLDLMALGDVLLLPEDDLSLAALLKSPVFGMSDDDLFRIGEGRTGCLWDALEAAAQGKPAYAQALARLTAWRAEAPRRRPFEFYMARLEADGLRRALLERLGPEAGDAMDEFLNLALAYEQGKAPCLQGFLHWLRVSEPEIKRDMEQERDEVRVMTVHGSKGLEANIVFLADTCSARSSARGGLAALPAPPSLRGVASLPAWLLSGSRLVPQIRIACNAAQDVEREEYQRLLYVAMTRARDCLYVAGFEGVKGRDRGCWYDLVCEGLVGKLAEMTDSLGNSVRRMICDQTAPAPAAAEAHAPRAAEAEPRWASARAVAEARPMLVNPSRLDIADSRAVDAQLPSGRGRGQALHRGRLVHRLLELLPALPEARRARAASRFLEAEAKHLTREERAGMLDAVFGILRNREFGALFGPSSQAEVALLAELPGRSPGEPPCHISGQVDRLVATRSEILIVDFKSGGAIPRQAEGAPLAYVVQLAAYRLALARLFPGKPLRAALLWTDGPAIMDIPAALLDEGERQLYESLRARHLDQPVACS